MYKLVIFDFDGTLVDSTPGMVKIMHTVVKEFDLPVAIVEDWRALIGVPITHQMKVLFPERDDLFHNQVVQSYRTKYDATSVELSPPFEGMQAVIAALLEAKITVTIATSKRRHLIEGVLRHLKMEDFFSLLIGPEDVENHKPHPESVLKTLERLSIEPSEAVVVGDSPFDLEMAQAAGVDAIGVTTGVHNRVQLESAHPKHIVSRLTEVLPIILNSKLAASGSLGGPSARVPT